MRDRSSRLPTNRFKRSVGSQAEGRGFDPHRPLQILRNIEANPQVALVFDRYNDDWERLAWVLLRGGASLVTAGGR